MRRILNYFKNLHFRKDRGKDYWQSVFCLFLRVALAATFLSAVADRFGLWSSFGGLNVSSGSYTEFTAVTSRILSFFPHSAIPMLTACVTIIEVLIGLLLILGIFARIASIASGLLLLIYALVLCIDFGIKMPLNMSIFTAATASFLLATMGPGRWSLDHLSSE